MARGGPRKAPSKRFFGGGAKIVGQVSASWGDAAWIGRLILVRRESEGVRLARRRDWDLRWLAGKNGTTCPIVRSLRNRPTPTLAELFPFPTTYLPYTPATHSLAKVSLTINKSSFVMASKAAAAAAPALLSRLSRPVRPWLLRAWHTQSPRTDGASSRGLARSHVRLAHSIPRPRQPEGPSLRLKPEDEAEAIVSGQAPASEGERPAVPRHAHRQSAYYQLSFTCVPCGHRSHHNISKQGYHSGSILITCPGCRDRHVISDHLEIFGDRKITVEQLMRERGRLVKRGSLGEDGDVEFWPDETPDDSAGEASERLTGASTEARDS